MAQAAAYFLFRLYRDSPKKRRRRTPQLDARDSAIRELFAGGVHPNQIAAQFSITPERVYQLIKVAW